MTLTVEIRLAEIRARLTAATPGKWICAQWSTGIVGPAAWEPNKGTCVAVVNHDCDKNFIAHAPEDISFLLGLLPQLGAGAPPSASSRWVDRIKASSAEAPPIDTPEHALWENGYLIGWKDAEAEYGPFIPQAGHGGAPDARTPR